MNHAENQMFNWSRDFIQTHTSKHGFCEDREYRRIFRLFQRCTAMKENPLIFSGYCKKMDLSPEPTAKSHGYCR